MKKKTIVMMATTLIALLLLTPMVKAGVMHYWWDNVYFVDGTDIDYPHPDNVYYDISRNTDWTKLGYALYHCQINKDSTLGIIAGSVLLSGILGLAVTVWLGGGTAATVVGGVTGLALMSLIPVVIDYYFVDERGCIWFWVSDQFVDWLIANLSWLGPLCQSNPAGGYGQILIAFVNYGYLRVGSVTFHDALGIVGPKIYNLTISVGSGGTTSPSPTTYECFEGTSVTVTAIAYSGYYFDYWRFDGATVNSNPITVTMNSDHTLKAYFQYSGGGGGGNGECPYVSVWDGSNYVLDNNILPTSQLGNGADVEDYYRLEQTLVRQDGKYSLLISEFEKEHSYIDQVKLLAVDHESDVNIAVAPDGEFLTYKDPVAPLYAVDVNETDRLNQIRYMDGDLSDPATFFQGTEDDYLLLNFGQVNSENAKLIVRNDMYCMIKCINVQVMDSNGEWQTVALIASRTYWAVEGVDLSPYVMEGRDLLVRLGWTMPHKLDYVGLDTTKQDDYELHEANLVSATHSTQGDVKGLLQEGDNTHAELIPGQQIQLEFTLPCETKQTRTFILYAEGRYDPMP